MAIAVPNFQISAISPGSLSRNRDRDTFGDSLNQAINFAFQRQLLEASAESRLEAQRIGDIAAGERNISSLIAGGNIIPEDAVDPDLENLVTFTSKFLPEDAGDFITQASVADARRERNLDRPLTTFGGIPTVEGTTVRDATFGGQFNPAFLASLTKLTEDDVEGLRAQAQRIPVLPGDPRGQALERIEADEASGGRTTILERNQTQEDFFSGVNVRGYGQLLLNISNMEQEDRARVNQQRLNITRSFTWLNPATGVNEEVPPQVLLAISSVMAGIDVDPEMKALADSALTGGVLQRRADLSVAMREMGNAWRGAGVEGTAFYFGFVDWLQRIVVGVNEDGTVANPEAAKFMEDNYGAEISNPGMETFAKATNSSGFRQAYAFIHGGIYSKSEFLRLQSSDTPFPFATDAANMILGILIPTYNDVEDPADGQNIGSVVSPRTLIETEVIDGGAVSDVDQGQGLFADFLSSVPQDDRDRMRRAFLVDSHATQTDSLLTLAENYRNSGQESAAIYFEGIAEQDSVARKAFVNAILLPVLNR